MGQVLSPYLSDHSALNDCVKLIEASFTARTAVMIYGFQSEQRPIEMLIDSFELLASAAVALGERHTATFGPLTRAPHPPTWHRVALGGRGTRQRARGVSPPVRSGLHEGRPACTSQELQRALHDLDVEPKPVRADDWPAGLHDLDLPGLYSWWVDRDGAADLSAGLGVRVQAGRIYAGQAGTTKWPSGKIGKATLGSRIGAQHLRGNVRGSTFRRTLAVALMRVLDLRIRGPRRLDAESERRLSEWMWEHLSVAVHAMADRAALGHLERLVLAELDPPAEPGCDAGQSRATGAQGAAH